jgi:transcriptional regulator with XRE-family HTH domain
MSDIYTKQQLVRSTIAEKLKQLRDRSRLSKTEVASRMGTSHGSISKFESGEQEVRLDTIQRYCEAVGASILEVTEAVDEAMGWVKRDGKWCRP